MDKIYLRGFVIPPGYRKAVKWVNETPHLSARAANLHRSTLTKLGKDLDFSKQVYEWLISARVKGATEAYAFYRKLGPRATFEYMIRLIPSALSSQKYLAKMVMDPQDEWKIDPTLSEDSYIVAAKVLHDLVKQIEHPALLRFEVKAFLKYASDANRRNFEEYVRQVKENYLPGRRAFAKAKLPKMDAYDLALAEQEHMFSPTTLGINDPMGKLIEQGDFLASARRDTFGGAPYYRNMADYLDLDDPNNDMTYADLYDELALLWLFLPPFYKERIAKYYQYSGLERVQTGGVSEYTGMEASLDDFKSKQNKQRFVQAESAIFPRALKAIHDYMREVWKAYLPLAADKMSEEEVTQQMKNVAKHALDIGWNIQGADYTNFDASIEICSLNDSYFNLIRMHMPSWIVYYIIDPYFKVAFRSQIYVPGIGLVTTTGIKSGMIITNQGDCFYANFCDLYELARWLQDHES